MMTLEEVKGDDYVLDYCKAKGIQPEDIKCLECLDGEHYPQYGRAPHAPFDFCLTGKFILDKPEVWPDNFVSEKDENGEELKPVLTGMYYCENKDCENHKDGVNG